MATQVTDKVAWQADGLGHRPVGGSASSQVLHKMLADNIYCVGFEPRRRHIKKKWLPFLITHY